MRNPDIDDELKNLQIDPGFRNGHKQELKQQLMQMQTVKNEKFSGISRLFYKNNSYLGPYISEKPTYYPIFSYCIILIALLSILVLSQTTNSAKAQALSLADKSVVSIKKLDVRDLDTLRRQFSGDPIEALNEAKRAIDLKIISKKEYISLKEDAKTVVITNKTEYLKDGGKVVSGSVISKGSAGTSDETAMLEVESSIGSIPDLPEMKHEDNNESINRIDSDKATDLGKVINPEDVIELQKSDDESAEKYLSYTKHNGNNVIIGIDNRNIPLFRAELEK